jgi:hypothetical protein
MEEGWARRRAILGGFTCVYGVGRSYLFFRDGFYYRSMECFPSGIGQSFSKRLMCTYGEAERSYSFSPVVDFGSRERILQVEGRNVSGGPCARMEEPEETFFCLLLWILDLGAGRNFFFGFLRWIPDLESIFFK